LIVQIEDTRCRSARTTLVGLPPCRPALNKHTYFIILQIVESAFCTSTWAWCRWYGI